MPGDFGSDFGSDFFGGGGGGPVPQDNGVYLYATRSAVPVGGTPLEIMWGPLLGGLIANPPLATEVLFVDMVAPASLQESVTTNPIWPGGYFIVPNGFTGTVTVNAATSGHQFSAFIIQPPPTPPTPQPGNFPPSGPTTLTDIIPSYLYVQYNDDPDLPAFVEAFNTLARVYSTWFTTISLPVYTGSQIQGPLLDLVAAGIYGIIRPSISSGRAHYIGPFNTYAFNTHAFNALRLVGPSDVTVASDDTFKRIITWNFYKGDGSAVTPNWIKRRVLRFLLGTDGTAPDIPDTYAVAVYFSAVGGTTISINSGTRVITGGAMFNTRQFNRIVFNGTDSVFTPGPTPFAYQAIFKAAMESGVLQMPFQLMPITVQA